MGRAVWSFDSGEPITTYIVCFGFTSRHRSGGVLVACTPEGYVLDAFEFMGSESCTQRYVFIARLKELFPDLACVFHDDACHLRQFADRRAAWSGFGKKLAHPLMKYILDRFHASGHVDQWCKDNVHPENEENIPFAEGRNTSRCEIFFSTLARHKHVFRTMGRWTAIFFLQEIVEMRNDDWCDVNTSDSTRSVTLSSSSSSSASSSCSTTNTDTDA